MHRLAVGNLLPGDSGEHSGCFAFWVLWVWEWIPLDGWEK